MTNSVPSVEIKRLGVVDYQSCWQSMRDFTESRTTTTPDQFWLVQHPPVFTLGQAGKPEHILNAGNIPIVKTDRGGQVTYHGPGQLIVYTLINLKRLNIGARALVNAIENSLIALLESLDIKAFAKPDAPGVYVNINSKHQSPLEANDAKIAALGLRIRKGCSYHGLSLNIDMNLEPFKGINPCGYEGQAVCQVSDFINPGKLPGLEQQLIQHLAQQLGLSIEKPYV